MAGNRLSNCRPVRPFLAPVAAAAFVLLMAAGLAYSAADSKVVAIGTVKAGPPMRTLAQAVPDRPGPDLRGGRLTDAEPELTRIASLVASLVALGWQPQVTGTVLPVCFALLAVLCRPGARGGRSGDAGVAREEERPLHTILALSAGTAGAASFVLMWGDLLIEPLAGGTAFAVLAIGSLGVIAPALLVLLTSFVALVGLRIAGTLSGLVRFSSGSGCSRWMLRSQGWQRSGDGREA
jgi:hypothetical protein